MRRQYFFWLAIVALGSALIGILVFLAVIGPAAFQQSQKELLENDRAALYSIRALVNTGNALSYGTVVSVDPANQVLYVSIKDPFGKAADTTLALHVRVPVYIAHQELLGSDGVATGLSRAVISSLADVQPGEHAAFTFSIGDNNEFETHYLLFGDPL